LPGIGLTAVATLATACIAGGGPRVCGSRTRPPDAHGRQLGELLTDPVFTGAPAGIRYMQVTSRAAQWHQGVDGAAWSGAHVSAAFTTSLPRPALDRLFDRFVEQAGWTVDHGNRPPDSRQWAKTLPGGGRVVLDLWPDPATELSGHFSLAGNVDVPCT